MIVIHFQMYDLVLDNKSYDVSLRMYQILEVEEGCGIFKKILNWKDVQKYTNTYFTFW